MLSTQAHDALLSRDTFTRYCICDWVIHATSSIGEDSNHCT